MKCVVGNGLLRTKFFLREIAGLPALNKFSPGLGSSSLHMDFC